MFFDLSGEYPLVHFFSSAFKACSFCGCVLISLLILIVENQNLGSLFSTEVRVSRTYHERPGFELTLRSDWSSISNFL